MLRSTARVEGHIREINGLIQQVIAEEIFFNKKNISYESLFQAAFFIVSTFKGLMNAYVWCLKPEEIVIYFFIGHERSP